MNIIQSEDCREERESVNNCLCCRFSLPYSSSVISEDPFSPAPLCAAWLLVSFLNVSDKFNFMPELWLVMWLFMNVNISIQS